MNNFNKSANKGIEFLPPTQIFWSLIFLGGVDPPPIPTLIIPEKYMKMSRNKNKNEPQEQEGASRDTRFYNISFLKKK